MKKSFIIYDFVIFAAALGITTCTYEDHFLVPICSSLPSVVTFPPEQVTSSTATLSGCIISSGFGNISEEGIYIYESGGFPEQLISPVQGTGEKKLSDFILNGKFYVFVSDLQPGTAFNYMAFATNEAGTIYGEIRILVTSYGTVDDNNGNSYQTVKIGDQIWMRENLRSEIYPCGYNISGCFDSADDATFGKHYNWQAVSGSGFNMASGVDACPAGWHIPSDSEWQKLLTFLGIPSDQLQTFGFVGNNQAAMLKDSGSNYWKDEDNNNSTGFSVLPAGVYAEKRDILGPVPITAFWTSTPYIYYGFQRGTEMIIRGKDTHSTTYLSVRYIKN
jgi:uncharacterized protein (TIGR02145 family)